jgi:hypothetical protein
MNSRFKITALLCITIIALALAGCSKKAEAQGVSSSGSSSRSTVRESPVSDFSYELTSDGRGIRIIRYTGAGGAVVIPSAIEGFPVLVIGYSAFRGSSSDETNNCNAVTSIVVPNSVEIIDIYDSSNRYSSAFQSMQGLTKVTLPDSLRVIPETVFRNCRKLASINLPASLEEIGYEAFRNCVELTDLVIPDSLTGVRFPDLSNGPTRDQFGNNYAFYGCQKLPIRTRQRLQELGYESGF